MTIKVDASDNYVLVKCTACPWWHAFGNDQLDGWRKGAAHEQREHRNSEQARDALRKAATRHAG